MNSPTSSYHRANTVNAYDAAEHRYFNMTKQRYVMEWSDCYSQLHFADFHAPRLCHLINVDLQPSTAAAWLNATKQWTQQTTHANVRHCRARHRHICLVNVSSHLTPTATYSHLTRSQVLCYEPRLVCVTCHSLLLVSSVWHVIHCCWSCLCDTSFIVAGPQMWNMLSASLYLLDSYVLQTQLNEHFKGSMHKGSKTIYFRFWLF